MKTKSSNKTPKRRSNSIVNRLNEKRDKKDKSSDKKYSENLIKLQRDLAIALSATSELDIALEKIIEATFFLAEIDCGGVYIIEKNTGDIILVSHKGLPEKFVNSASKYSSESPQFKMIQKGQPIYGHFSKISPSNYKAHNKENLKLIAVLPLFHEKKVIGALNLASHSYDEILPDTKNALETIATQVGGMIARIQMGEDLKNNQTNFQNLFNTLDDFLFILDVEGKILDYNPVVLNRLGYSAKDLAKMHVIELHPANRRNEAALIIEQMKKGKLHSCPVPIQTKKGDLIEVETKVSKGIWNDKPVLFGISRDISERKQIQEKLIEEHSFNSTVIKNAAEGLCVCHAIEEFPYVEFTVWNNQMQKITGHSLEQINKKGWYQSLYPDPDIQKKAIDRMSRMRVGDDINSEEWEIVCANGDKKNISISTSILQTSDNEIHVLGLMQDVTERKNAEEKLRKLSNNLELLVNERTKKLEETNILLKKEISERAKIEQSLRESEEKYRSLVDISPDAITLTDMKGNILMTNSSALEVYGYDSVDEMVGLDSMNFVAHEDKSMVLKMLNNSLNTENNLKFLELRNVKKDGTTFPVEVHARILYDSNNKPIGTINTVRDITERKRMEEELLKSEKLESVGVLAGGIAHDFNNLLTGIIGNISLAKMYKDSEKDLFDRLIEAEKASFRAKDLTQKLLTFSKGGNPVKTKFKIVDLLQDTIDLALSGSNVKCKFNFADELCAIEADEGQISQVISNVVINAKQVMPKGGIININCNCIKISAKDKLPLKSGEYIKISIIDQGTGISKDHLPYIFDPYFTTKQSGNGLGLATAYSIINKHHGFISAVSEIEKGTEIIIYLPALKSRKNLESVDKSKIKPKKKRILVMDDESMIRDISSKMLDSLGYEVVCTENGEETIKLYQKFYQENNLFDLVIMDLTIPAGMGGKETIIELQKINPDVVAIVSSGYSNNLVMSNFTEFGFKGVIAKPFQLKELKEEINKVLN